MRNDQDGTPSNTRVPPAQKTIARKLALGFGSVSVIAIITCGLLIALIDDVADLVQDMRHDESAIRAGHLLASAVREQYMHIAHTAIEADESHVQHYGKWYQRVRAGIDRVANVAPSSQRWRADTLRGLTKQMDSVFRTTLLPAVRAGNLERARVTHRRVEELGKEASRQADALAYSIESRMVHAHRLAIRATHLGLLSGGVGMLLVVGLSIGHTQRLRAALMKPLEALTRAARRFASGDFAVRVGAVGGGELLALATAFDHMAEELVVREHRIVNSERMAAIGQLAAGVAHELNNPIGIIRGYLKTMDPAGDPGVLRGELQILDEEAAQCQRIAEDLLAYARQPDLALEQVDIPAWLEETRKRLHDSGMADGVSVEIDAEPGVISADPVRLRQVVSNLVVNAIQSSEGRPVAITGRRLAAGYEISVLDRGPGIPVRDRARIFEPFFTRREGGSGLGLAVCQGIVRAHGGTISVGERPGRGAVFRVRLPASPGGVTKSGAP